MALGLVLQYQPQADALSGSDWKAGNIISDSQFYSSGSMSASQIKSWIDARITCDINGSKTSEYGGGHDYNGDGRVSRSEWARKTYGYTGKFICLDTYYEHPTSHDTNLRDGVRPSGSISAASILKRAADKYHISPKVLLVTLQKESPGPLTSDNWPLPWQFDAALGYACPDPPAGQPVVCDPAYKGFYRQVMNAAKGIYNYKLYSSSFRYQPFKDNRILYNPNTDCGSSTVYIHNYATAGLYNYTPYQPNKAALNNLYGTGDGCSAYGNRNFWTMYHRFFGSTTGISLPPARRITGPGSSSTITEAATEKVVSVRFKNAGTTNWYDIDSVPEGGSNLVLEATHVTGGESGFNAKFASPTRATQRFAAVYKSDGTKKTEAESNHIVTPGQTVQFNFTISSPSTLTNGEYRIAYRPLLVSGATAEGYLSNAHTFYVRINNSIQAARITGPGSSSTTMKAGETKQVAVRFKNTGSVAWHDIDSMTESTGNVVLEATHIAGGASGFNTGFASSNRATQRFAAVHTSDGKLKTNNENVVDPGETVTFQFTITAPDTLKPGKYTLAYKPIMPATSESGARHLIWNQVFYITIE